MKKSIHAAFAVTGALGSILASSAILTGCGSAPQSMPAVGGIPGAVAPGCVAGQYPMYGGCTAVTDLTQACYQMSGQLTTLQGVQVCRASVTFNTYTGYGTVAGNYSISYKVNLGSTFPRLYPGDVAGTSAADLGIQLYAGDKLTFAASGGWGSTSANVKSYLGGVFQTVSYKSDCDKVGVDGSTGDGIATNQGAHAGLYGTDGTEIFALGSSTQRVIAHNGRLKLGFNTPYVPSSCATLTIKALRIERCFDASGKTYTCQ